VFISNPSFAVLLMIDMSFAYGREQSCIHIAYCIWERMKFLWWHSC